VVFLAGGAAAGRLSGHLSHEFSFPDTAAGRANHAILTTYGNGATTYPLVPVVTLAAGTTADDPAVARAFQAAVTTPRMRLVSYPSTGDRRFVGTDGRTVFGLVFTPPAKTASRPDYAAQISRAMVGALPAGATVHVTGVSELAVAQNGCGKLCDRCTRRCRVAPRLHAAAGGAAARRDEQRRRQDRHHRRA